VEYHYYEEELIVDYLDRNFTYTIGDKHVMSIDGETRYGRVDLYNDIQYVFGLENYRVKYVIVLWLHQFGCRWNDLRIYISPYITYGEWEINFRLPDVLAFDTEEAERDMRYFHQRLVEGLGVPRRYLGLDDNVNLDNDLDYYDDG